MYTGYLSKVRVKQESSKINVRARDYLKYGRIHTILYYRSYIFVKNTHKNLGIILRALKLAGLISVLIFGYIGIVIAASTWTQTDWSGGSGQTSWSDITKFSTSSDIDYSVTGQISIQAQTNWYNSDWDYRKNITFDNSAQASNLVNFPVQVALTSSNFDFSKAKTNGEDIRFTDSNGTTLLDYEIEKWDQAGEQAWIWVNVPQINSSSTTDSVYMYYGNAAASDAENPSGTWNSNYALVYHLEQTGACPPATLFDSTSHNNDGFCEGTPTFTNSGKIDGARNWNDLEWIYALDSPDFTQNQMTISLWANQDSLSSQKAFASKWFYQTQGSWAIQTGNADNTQIQVFIADSLTDAGDNSGITNTGAWSTGWHNVTFTYDSAGSGNSGKLKVYVDGIAQSLSFNGTIPSSMQNSDANFRIGDFGNLHRYWNGSLDEVRIATAVQTPDWIAASYKSGNNTFNTFGAEEGLYPSTASLTSSIFDTTSNTTFDTLTYSATTPSNTAAAVKVRTSNSATMSGAPAFGTCTAVTSGSDMSGNACVTDTNRYIQYLVTLTNTDSISTPTFNSVSLNYTAADPTPTSGSGGGSGSSGSSNSSNQTTCTQQAPGSSPNLYQIKSGANSSVLYFTPTGGNTTGYTISYGTTTSANTYSASFNSTETNGAQTYTINDLSQNTIWYFKVRSNNNCAPGPFSGVMSSTTTSPTTQNIVQKLFSQKSISPVTEIRRITTPTPTPPKPAVSTCEHTIESGDTLWKIARKYLGEGSKFSEIVELNKKEFPYLEDALTMGETIRIPCKKQTTAAFENEKEIKNDEPQTYDLEIKLSADGKPLDGAAVEIHSKVQKTIASAQGVASFRNVEPGEHTVKIAYENYTGEHKIALTGKEKDVEIDLSIKLVQNGFASRPVQIVIALLILAVITQGVFIMRKKHNARNNFN